MAVYTIHNEWAKSITGWGHLGDHTLYIMYSESHEVTDRNDLPIHTRLHHV